MCISSRTSNLPSPASFLKMRSKSSFVRCSRPMGWSCALPFKTRQKKQTQRQTALSKQHYGMPVFPPKKQRNKITSRCGAVMTTLIWDRCSPSGGRQPSHLLPSPVAHVVSIHGCVYVLPVLLFYIIKNDLRLVVCKEVCVRQVWLLTLCLHPGDA